MSNVPADLRYTKSHEWVRVESDGTMTVGITDHAQAELGDLVFVEANAIGSAVSAGAQAATVESVKAASEVYAPASGEIIAFNDDLSGNPGLVNSEPTGAGWIFKLRLSDPSEIDALMDEDAYNAMVLAG